MAKKLDLIKLPMLKSIHIRGYRLFNGDWSYNFKTGLNLFLGANGLGKTTSANLIMYGIVGEVKETPDDRVNSFSSKYFRFRIKSHAEIPSDTAEAVINLSFYIGDDLFIVERLIEKPKIIYFKINGAIYDASNSDNIEQKYLDKLLQHSGIPTQQTVLFLLQKLLIREEEGNYLLWDVFDQSKIIRLLINAEGFEKTYNEQFIKTKKAFSKKRDTQYFISQLNHRLNELETAKLEELGSRKSLASRNDLIKQVDKLSGEIPKLKERRDHINKSVQYLKTSIANTEQSLQSLQADIEEKGDALLSAENEFYGNIYSDNKMLSTIHKLESYQHCVFCNTKISRAKTDEILNKFNSNTCPVCDSGMKIHSVDSEVQKGFEKELNAFRADFEKLKKEVDLKNSAREKYLKDYESQTIALKLVSKSIEEGEIEKLDLENKIANAQINPKELISAYDRDILAQKNSIKESEKEFADYSKAYDRELPKLEKLNEELNQTIGSFLRKLNKIFNAYSGEFFSEDCKLIPFERKMTESPVKLTHLVPEFDGKQRERLKDCSTYERIMLETLFRFSLVELYHETCGIKPFLIMESSEGAFDLANTANLGKAFKLFSENPFPFVTITNFSKPEFIKVILTGFKNPKLHTLNFLEFGVLNVIQQYESKQFEEVLKELKIA